MLSIKDFFKDKIPSKYFSPGRINLIGEHIDYNGGKVLPLSLSIGTTGYAIKRNDDIITCYSSNFEEAGIKSFLVDQSFTKTNSWIDYVIGVVKLFKENNYHITSGFDLYVSGNIPSSSGLSSSASLELLVCVILKDLFKFDITNEEMVKLSQKAENEFIGVNCGIMDQAIIGLGKENTAMLLDTKTFEYKYIKFDLKDKVIIIMNTKKPRSLITSKYNERREECNQALDILKKHFKIKSLCDLNVDSLPLALTYIADEKLQKRVSHVVSENNRVLEMVSSLEQNDYKKIGLLLNESHQSLKNDYEVSSFELNTMCLLALKEKGVYGARMTGAGFGGCAICLCDQDEAPKIIENVTKKYREITAIPGELIVATSGSGAGKI